jgi:hypothetical protein
MRYGFKNKFSDTASLRKARESAGTCHPAPFEETKDLVRGELCFFFWHLNG